MRCRRLHHASVAWLLAAILYGSAAAGASESAGEEGAARAAATPVIPHIALLLPAASAFVRATEAVRDGFLAAARTQGSAPLPVRIYAVDGADQTVAGYREALAAGAQLVIGPLTRDGVTALVASNLVTTPTLALNVPERTDALPPDLYMLSLHVEAEAQQVARFAAKEGRASVLAVVGGTPLLRRIHQAFVEEFTRLGGRVSAEHAFTADPDGLARIRQAVDFGTADMAFLALDFRRARLARPYLGALPVYATSQVNPGHSGPLVGFDLANVRFLDMPWLLQPDHPAVMVYPRRDFQDAVDLQRLYALGIDAFRVAQDLLRGASAITLDGVTGRLALGSDHRFTRELTAARFADGRLIVIPDGP
jgi:uncharacterized protein